MRAWFNRTGGALAALCRSRDGASASEFALMLPVLTLLFSGMAEIGRAYYQANQVEKGLRAGALFAARSSYPLSAQTLTATRNLTTTGSPDGNSPYLVSGWGKVGSELKVTFGNYVLDEVSIPVIRLSATVPLDPLLPVLASALGYSTYMIHLTHEQAHVGY
ncbi:MAG: pilus assembly protein [Rhodospirillales bacterium]|nr:pilus assembly protein [Rhodospirillales bacterium]